MEEQREELEAVAASLTRTPRLEQLLRFLVNRYLDGDTADLTEYTIATEVFGRKKTEFIASEDAIARVETHRLRKKLKTYYEGAGRNHDLQICIPLGTYVPQFMEHEQSRSLASRASTTVAPALLDAENAKDTPAEPFTDSSVSTSHDLVRVDPSPVAIVAAAENPRRRSVLLAVFALALIVAALTAFWFLPHSRISSGAGAAGASIATAAATPNPAAVAVPFRMIAGYSGAPQRDDEGNLWGPDRFFTGGWARKQSKEWIARTNNQFLFHYGRDGDISYNIPLQPGTYELHLYFMQGSDTAQSEDAENKEISTVHINDQIALSNFDIVSDAMGRNIADERVIRDVSPAADGMLHLQLSTVIGTPSIAALEILPGKPGEQLPLRLAMQPTSFTDANGLQWRPDNYFLGGRSLAHNLPDDVGDDVLPFERYGHFQYALPVDSRDRYTVTLRFVELFFGADAAGPKSGQRIFRVLCNGQTLLDDFDIQKEAGGFHLVTKTFHHLKPSAQGKLNIDFEPVVNYATVSSIEVTDEGH